MLDSIIKFSINNKLIVGLSTLLLILWGGYSLTKLPIDAVPDITNNQVQVITPSPSLAAEEVERLITFPIEITMATIPEIEHIRSFSRFGLSVVTLVFKEHVDPYWARQQVNERLSEVQSQIPPNIGQPSMAPITTGLGEIYQYVVGTKLGYEDKYSATELRTIQDWIIRRQLLGTPGVADVSSFGGHLKQYEVAIDPNRLKAMNISITQLFQALKNNNENGGGAYIEKNKNAYFIRSEGLITSLEDIRNIRIKNNENGIPILTRDVATVQFGHSVRYGATTRNGQGEVVSAIVMMLKGANSAEVIKNVKEKIEQIRKSLPKGVTIEPFLDRTKLVNTAIGTVSTNLIEGALIVIFILLLLLGNLRAGIIVASVIPLALLFAFAMMKLFGVSGNLMSLGAVDFGLIVDGAVIIVESTLHHLGLLKTKQKLTQQEMDAEVYQSARKIRNSAAFGEIIILIVYLPILALVGTEGKMFRPMAQTVTFAIAGAFILSLTYVPMMSSLFLSKKRNGTSSISDKIMDFLHKLYDPLIRRVMDKKSSIITLSIILFAFTLWVFSRLGGEFIPTLEEGDFAVETRVITGSSLENTIEATTQAEQILLEQFPEVKQVVSKIGAGEIPTDPMPIEAADMMIILKDKSEWVTAKDRETLANKMTEALEAIPGVTFGFQQPIQMRFNELMTGVRQDVAIKIYGDDLDRLSSYAQQVGKIASEVEGAVDLYVEEVTGVPQIVIDYKRGELAKYGLSISDVNHSVETAFAGTATGLVFEHEKRFDMVVRFDKSHRNSIDDVKNLFIARDDGHQIPLYQVADIQIKEGPYQIQRDNTQRRILVAFNVRNRDVETVVNELRQRIDNTITLSPGYSITYGGQFENLMEARQRLATAVPLALMLIFILLYFTFKSIKQSILVFSAIPLSAIGGVFALWMRDMPFSISAGVGFIALFGVAVLNGIVLIAEFNHLKKQGVADIFERIYQGTKIRLRPVVMTASVASLGFLPMALSNSSGAEVQKPLATVVIGGLLSATLLTLIVLPILYYYIEKGFRIKSKFIIPSLIIGWTCLSGLSVQAQNQQIIYYTLDEAIKTAVDNHPTLKAADLEVSRQKALRGSSWNIPKTKFELTRGQYNSIRDDDNQFKISQNIDFPTVYINRSKLAKAKIKSKQWLKIATQNELIREVKATWYNLWLAKSKAKLLLEQDQIYQKFAKAANLRYETGETNLLEKVTADSKVGQVQLMLQQNQSDINLYKLQLKTLLNASQPIDVVVGDMEARVVKLPVEEKPINNPTLAWFKQQIEVSKIEKSVVQAQMLPDLSFGYFNQSLNGPNTNINGNAVTFNSDDRFTGFQAGIAIPLFGARSQLSSIKAAELKKQIQQERMKATENNLQRKLNKLIQQYRKHQTSLAYYNQTARQQAELMLQQAQKSFNNGAIDYVAYVQGISQAMSIRLNHLDALNEYNQTIIQIESILGIQ